MNADFSLSPEIEEWLDRLQASGYRVTAPRRAVVETVAGNAYALDPADIFIAARRRSPRLGLVTVYRTLEKLEQLGLVQRVHQPDGCHAYIASAPGHQHLLVCQHCNRTEYFTGDDLDPLIAQLGRDSGFLIQDHWLQLYGLCAACRQAEGSRMIRHNLLITSLVLAALLISGCGGAQAEAQAASTGGAPRVMASTSFLADIAQNVAGDRLQVQTLVPLGTDPHEYQPSPQDLAHLSESTLLITNGAGYEHWLEKTLQNLDGNRTIIEASQGLTGRSPQTGVAAIPAGEVDPHFWLDPNLAVRYVENIRDGLSAADPQGAGAYRENASAYITQLKELDGWIRAQVEQVPPGRRLLVTNHESLGYYADRYGFQIVGTIIPSVSTEASPSAQQVAGLVEAIRASGAPAIFLETGTNPKLAEQVAREAGVRVVTDLYTESLTPADGPAPNYLAMLRHDTQTIVEALKP